MLSSAPDLLRKPRVGTVADRVDLPAITAIAVPDPEPAVIAAPSAPRPAAPVVDLEPTQPIAAPEPVAEPDPSVVIDPAPAADAAAGSDPDAPGSPSAPDERPAVVTSEPPLAAGSTELARFLRDNDYAFTGTVLGPVSVGVFRSNLDAAPIVVSLGQTLPNTEIVLTDLRGMQAELTLGQTHADPHLGPQAVNMKRVRIFLTCVALSAWRRCWPSRPTARGRPLRPAGRFSTGIAGEDLGPCSSRWRVPST